MEYIQHYLFFLAKIITFVGGTLLLIAGIAAIIQNLNAKNKNELTIESLNENYDDYQNSLYEEILSPKEYKKFVKEAKEKQKARREATERKTIFVIDFNGDLRATQVNALREEISAIILVAKSGDEVLVRLKSPGGTIPSYGLAAAQLKRLKQAGIRLVAAVDEIAASGGYLMAAVANHIVASPFAILGSIGVVGQLPTLNLFLKQHHIGYELHTAGKYKRTLTVLGENTEEAREKFREELEDAHHLFQEFLHECRPQLDLSRVATGEYWYGKNALAFALVDELMTSDQYLQQAADHSKLLKIKFKTKPSFFEKMRTSIHKMVMSLYSPEEKVFY